MKEQDNKTTSICYCKGNKGTTELFVPKDEEKLISERNTQNKIDAGKKQPWSMFEGWYWL